MCLFYSISNSVYFSETWSTSLDREDDNSEHEGYIYTLPIKPVVVATKWLQDSTRVSHKELVRKLQTKNIPCHGQTVRFDFIVWLAQYLLTVTFNATSYRVPFRELCCVVSFCFNVFLTFDLLVAYGSKLL